MRHKSNMQRCNSVLTRGAPSKTGTTNDNMTLNLVSSRNKFVAISTWTVRSVITALDCTWTRKSFSERTQTTN